MSYHARDSLPYHPDAIDSATAVDSDWRIYIRLLRYVGPWRGLFAASLVGFLIYSLGNVLLADLFGFLLDALNSTGQAIDSSLLSAGLFRQLYTGEPAQESLRVLVPLLLVMLTLLRAMGYFLGSWCMNIVARSVIHRLRCEVFEVLQYAPSSYFDTHSRGEMIARITYTVEQVSDAVTRALKTAVREGLVVVMLLAYLFYSNWLLSLVFIGVAPLIALVVRRVGRYFRYYSRGIQSSMGDVTQLSNEGVSGYRELRLFGGRERQQRRFESASASNRRQALKLALVDALATPVVQTLIAGALALLIWFAMSPAMLEQYSAGQFAAFLIAALQLGKPIRQLSGVQAVVQKGLAAAEDIFSQLDMARERSPGKETLEHCRGELEFRGISFSYPETDRPVLRDIDLHIPAGETLALVGPSGSGKSTLVHLLAGFYEPDAGHIRLDGKPLAAFTLESRRAQMAFVPQDVTLFHDTVFNNIAFAGLADKDAGSVERAARVAGALPFIQALPHGFDTQVGEGGALLSTGQRQRIAIARAVLKDAPILILDEASSALDNESEFLLQQAMAELTRGRTTLVIAHRLTTIENADNIAVLDAGRVVERGTHCELLARNGLYARLHQLGFPQ